MLYRDEPPKPPNPSEEAAVAELDSRTKAAREAIIVLHIAGGVAMGSVLYALLSNWQLEHRGAHSPYVTGMISFVPTFGGMLRLGPSRAQGVAPEMEEEDRDEVRARLRGVRGDHHAARALSGARLRRVSISGAHFL